MHVRTLIVNFSNEIASHEIPLFRGAVVHALDNKQILFHNHTPDGFRYAYPLIQYKRIHGRAAIVCIGEGVEAVGELFASDNLSLSIGARQETFHVAHLNSMSYNVQLCQQVFPYRINRWLPLNADNYVRFMATESIVERAQMLEHILTGNILSFAKGIGLRLDEQLRCTLTHFDEPRLVRAKGIKMMCFNAQFRSNISLPDYIGLGKHPSFGYGVVTHVGEREDDETMK